MWFDAYCCFCAFRCGFGIGKGVIPSLSMVAFNVYFCTLPLMVLHMLLLMVVLAAVRLVDGLKGLCGLFARCMAAV